ALPAATATVVLLALGTWWFMSPASAAEETATAWGEQLEAGLIPVDRQGRESAGKRYITPRLLRELNARRQSRHRGEAWLISNGFYDGALQLGSEPDRLVVGTWTLTFEVETFASDVAVEFPLLESQAVWNGTASVDGIPLPIKWNEG